MKRWRTEEESSTGIRYSMMCQWIVIFYPSMLSGFLSLQLNRKLIHFNSGRPSALQINSRNLTERCLEGDDEEFGIQSRSGSGWIKTPFVVPNPLDLLICSTSTQSCQSFVDKIRAIYSRLQIIKLGSRARELAQRMTMNKEAKEEYLINKRW